jgi:nucleoside-diphosphate-sugar epimerase
MKRVLLTGGTGFIGRHALKMLQDRGYEVHAISSREVACGSEGVTWYQVDLLNHEAVTSLVGEIKPTHLLHIAWDVTHGKFWNSPSNLDWVQASLNLFRAFAANGGERATVAGSCTEYDWGHSLYSESKTPFNPSSLYGTCKRALHLILRSFAKEAKISLAWGYIFYLFGPHEHENRFLPAIIRSLLLQKEVPCSHGRQIRDFLYVKDVAGGLVALLDSELTGGVNIASGQGIALRELASKVARNPKDHGLLKFGALPPPQNDPTELVADVTRLREELKWQPQYTLEEGLQETLSWWEEELSVKR